LEFGGVPQVQEEVRDAWGVRLFDNLSRDFSYAVRVLTRERAYTLMAVLTLALGIGSNTALFSVVHQLLLSPLPYRDGDRITVLGNLDRDTGRNGPFSHLEKETYKAEAKQLEDVAELHNMRFTLLNRKEAEVVETGVVSANYFDFFGIKPLYGRIFAPGEDKHGAPPVLLLSHRYFQKSFGGDISIIGQSVHLNDRMHTVIGVLPPLPEYPQRIDVFMPTSSCPFRSGEQFLTTPRARMLTLYGRLKKDVQPPQVEAELTTIARRLRSEHSDAYPKHDRWSVSSLMLKEELAKNARPTFLLLFGATGLVLLIACANVANLSLSRALKRDREMAIRGALGAGRGRILQQLAIEGVLVSIAGGLLGVFLANQTLGLLARFAERFSPRAYAISVDQTVLIFSVVISVITGVLFCALPAWRRKRDLVPSLKDGGAMSAGAVRSRMRGALVAVQVGFSFVLLIGAGLLFRSFLQLIQVEKGFRVERVLSMQISPNFTKLNTPQSFQNFFEALLEKMKATPGVESAGMGARVPLNQRLPLLRNFIIEHQQLPDGAPRPTLDLATASPGYFATLGIPLISGRDFTPADGPNAPLAAIINQSMARHRWPGQDPVGRRVSFDNGRNWITIVGVVGDTRFNGLDQEIGDQLYRPFAQAGGTSVVIRSAGDPQVLMRDIRAAVRQLDPEQAIAELRPMQEIVSDNLASPRLTTTLLGLFAALTMLVTVAGISGVAALSVNQRRSEIGIRLALGARPLELVGMIVRQEMAMVLAGLVIGVAGALALTRMLTKFLFNTPPTDVTTFALAILMLAMVSAMACFLPARRAAAVDPTISLRSE
jgi:predicted permease